MPNGSPDLSAETLKLLVGLGAVTRMIRGRNRLSQVEVARRARLGKGFISAVEHCRANPNFAQLDQLARALGFADVPELLAKAADTALRIAAATAQPRP